MLKNTKDNYGWFAILLHWTMAVVIFSLFALGLYMVELTYYDAWYRGSLELHKSVGLILFLLWALRVLWRCLNEQPVTVATTERARLEQKAAYWMHMVLYAGLLSLMLSGYLISTADGRALEVFGWSMVPALPWSIAEQEDIAGEIHEVLAWGLIIMAALHALAALKHHFIDGDNTLKRILKSEK